MINLDSIQTIVMPDGMPHLIYEGADNSIICSIRDPIDLFKLQLLSDICQPIKIQIHYLMGSRMDRAISPFEPNTLRVVCDTLKTLSNRNIHIKDRNTFEVIFPHSQSTIDRLEARQRKDLELNFLKMGINRILNNFSCSKFTIALPDAGAEKRFYNDHIQLMQWYYHDADVVTCNKHRDISTGKLSGFHCPSQVGEMAIIIDDLCDGGGTFVGQAKELRKNGARKIGLIVYHGIFSKGQELEGIDYIVSSNSYRDLTSTTNFHCIKVI